MLIGAPFIHAIEHFVALVHDDGGPLIENIQVLVGDDGGDFDDAVGVRIEPGHFEIDPDEIFFVQFGHVPVGSSCIRHTRMADTGFIRSGNG